MTLILSMLAAIWLAFLFGLVCGAWWHSLRMPAPDFERVIVDEELVDGCEIGE